MHPAAFAFKLPDNVSFGEGAIVEPLAIGLQAAKKAAIKPGDVAVVIGAGTIGAMTAPAALAGGCSRVILAGLVAEKGGHIEQIGTPAELYNHPRTLFAAGFIGTPAMNFIDGVIDREGARN